MQQGGKQVCGVIASTGFLGGKDDNAVILSNTQKCMLYSSLVDHVELDELG